MEYRIRTSPTRRRGSPPSARSMVVSLLAALLALVALAPAAASAAICGCARTGGYVNPARALPAKGDLSPAGGEFRLEIIEQTPTQAVLHLTKAATGATVVDLPVWLARLDFGFSPDGKRFMWRYAFVDSEGPSVKFDVVGLHDLAAPGGARSVFYSEVYAGATTTFSPHGRWFELNQLFGPGNSEIRVLDAQTGQTAFSDPIIFTAPPGYPGDKFGVVGAGFSSDDGDRSFVRAFRDVNGQVQLVVRNLETRTNVVGTPVTSDSWWKFSPCGDVFGLVTQPDPVSLTVSMFETADGDPVKTVTLPIADSVRLESSLVEHLVIDVQPSGAQQPIHMGDNTADSACAPAVTLDQVVLSPTTVDGGDVDPTGTITLTAPATAATAVTLTSSDPAAATVPSSVTVSAGTSSKTFTVTTKAVTAARTVTITAKAGTVTRTATLVVNPAPSSALDSLTIAPARAIGGQAGATGTVTLAAPARAAGTVVTLSSSAPAAAAVPASVTVPQGQTTLTFPIATAAVRGDTPATITAVGGGYTRSMRFDVLTADRGCSPGQSDAAKELLKARSFGAYDDAGHNVDCVTNVNYKNGITVGAGSTGLPVGAPVTLALALRFDGANYTAPPTGSGGALADGTSTYSVIDESAPRTEEGVVQVADFRANFELQQYATGVNVFKRTNVALSTNEGAPQQRREDTEASSIAAAVMEVDTGSMTATYRTTVGAHLAIDARVSTVASAYGTGASAVADFSNTFQAATRPAAGFEGLALTYDVGVPPADQPPTCTAGAGAVAEDGVLTDSVSCTDLEGKPLTHTVVSGPAHGTVSAIAANGAFTYRPAANYHGADSFTFKASDGRGTSATVTYTVTVTAVNDAPTCTAGSGTTDAGKPLGGRIACTDVDGDALSYEVVAAPSRGSVAAVVADGSFTYTPEAGFAGTDSFTVAASDGTATATATFTVTVRKVLVGPPKTMDECKNDGWQRFNNPTFPNQGSCVAYTQRPPVR
jgi:hypothetical protein